MLRFLENLGQADQAIVQNALGARTDVQGWPDKFSCTFLESGLAYYPSENEDEEGQMVLVRKEAMDKMRASFVGKPVVNENHKEASPENFKEIADGVVTRVWHNAEDGWDYCDVVIWDEATKKNMRSGSYSVSCAYRPTDVDPAGGEHHNVKYSAEVLNGDYTHLAVVRNPRYEGARIILNSKGGRTMWSFFQKDKKNSKEIGTDATVDIDGKAVPFQDLVNAHKKAKKNDDDEKHREEINDDTVVEIDGEEMPFKNLKAAYRNMKKNEEAEEKKKKDDDKENEEAEEKKKKDDEKKNAKDAAKVAADAVKAEELKNARLKGTPSKIPQLVTQHERVALGAKRYGSTK